MFNTHSTSKSPVKSWLLFGMALTLLYTTGCFSTPPLLVDELPNVDWASSNEKVQVLSKGTATSPTLFQLNFKGAHGYIQSSPGSFSELIDGQGRAIPKGATKAAVDLDLSRKPAEGELVIFFVEYDDKGSRIKSGTQQQMTLPATERASLSATFPLRPDAARYILALRFADFQGEVAVNSTKVTFTGGK
jgi:hypothetical protein